MPLEVIRRNRPRNASQYMMPNDTPPYDPDSPPGNWCESSGKASLCPLEPKGGPAAARPRLWLAPIRGFTDAVYRTALAEQFGGIDLAIAPFITTHSGTRIKEKHVRDLLPHNNPLMPVVPQILSKSADDFVRLANHLFTMGYDCVNLNLGCPFPQVANKGRGAGMLPFPARVADLLLSVYPRLKGSLSIKTRLGRLAAEEIEALIPVFNRFPLREIIIHPRTGLQMYRGIPDLDVFGRCLAALAAPVVYNGDITDLVAFRRLAQRFPSVAGWMIGRGALANPLLPAMLKNDADMFQDKPALLKRFHDTLLARYGAQLAGPRHLLDHMKGFWTYWPLSFRESLAARKKILKARSLESYGAAVEAFFHSSLEWQERPVLESPALSGASLGECLPRRSASSEHWTA